MQRQEVILASAARAPGAGSRDTSAVFSPPVDADAMIVTVDITANPGGVDTIQPIVQAFDPASGKFTDYATFTALTAAVNQTFQKVLSSVAVAAPGGTNVEGKIGPLPQQFRVQVLHSAVTSHTYSVGVSYA